MTFLCFLGALPASLASLPMGSMVLFKIYGIALNKKNTRKPQEIPFYCDVQFTGEITAHMEINVTCCLSGYLQHKRTAIATGAATKLLQQYNMYYDYYTVMI